MASHNDNTQLGNQQKQGEMDPELDYDASKEVYLKEIDRIRSAVGIRALYNQERIDTIVRILKEYEELTRKGGQKLSTYYRMAKRYVYTEDDGNYGLTRNYTLLLKNGLKQIVSTEDSFDVLMEIHLATAHGGRDKMYSVIKPIYYIYKHCLQLIINSCNVCCAKRNTDENYVKELYKAQEKKPRFNREVSVDIFAMNASPDGHFNHLLAYTDSNTNFVLMRPLMKRHPFEVALELIKIFGDFEQPKKITTSSVLFFETVLKELKRLGFLEIEIDIEGENNRNFWLLSKVNGWIERSESNNWPIGCYEIQFEINTTRRDKKYPYRLAFNQKPNIIPRPSLIPRSSLIQKPSLSERMSYINRDMAKETQTPMKGKCSISRVSKVQSWLSKKRIDCRRTGQYTVVNVKSGTVRGLLKSSSISKKTTAAKPKVIDTFRGLTKSNKTNETKVNTDLSPSLLSLKQGDTVSSTVLDKNLDILEAFESETDKNSGGSAPKAPLIEKTQMEDIKQELLDEILSNESQTTITEKICKVCNVPMLYPNAPPILCDKCHKLIHERCGDWTTEQSLQEFKSVVVYLCNICKLEEENKFNLKKS